MALELNGTTGVSAVQTGAVESGDLPAGSVIQVVSAVPPTDVTSTSANWVDSNIELSITPSNTVSKIMGVCSYYFAAFDTTSTRLRFGVRMVRDGTVIAGGHTDSQEVRNLEKISGGSSITFLDSPNTTSLITYTLQFYVRDGTVIIRNAADTLPQPANITLMEIAG